MGVAKKICVVTGTRAEYGLLRPLLYEISNSSDFKLALVVTGSHLSKVHGETVNEIVKDGFCIEAKFSILTEDDSRISVSSAFGKMVSEFSSYLNGNRPDILLVLGDRYEILAAVVAASIMGVPVGHIAGGEITEGAFDDGFRHSITKLSNIHFATALPYAKRILQMGEDPATVFNTGSLGMDNIRQIKLSTFDDFKNSINVSLKKPYFLVTFHPVTLDATPSEQQFLEVLSALDCFPSHDLIFTKPNADPDGIKLIKILEDFALRQTGRVHVFSSLGVQRYFSAIKHSQVVIGNSSSGVAEVPFFKVPTVDIGTRQKGRISCASIIHAEPKKISIVNAIKKALSSDFVSENMIVESPYGDGFTASKILNCLRSVDFEALKIKRFFNIKTD